MTTTYRLRNILVALALAVVAVVLTLLYVGSVRAKAQSNGEAAIVYVAKGDIAVGTPGSEVIDHLIAARRVTRAAAAPDAITAPADLRRLVAVQPIYAGEQVTARRFGPVQASGVLADLRGRHRVIEVAGDANQLLAGMLKVGDRVDVVASFAYPDSGRHYSRIILRNLLVRSAPAAESAGSGVSSNSAPLAAALEVTDTQAQVLFYALKNAEWSLVLRPVLRPTDSGQPRTSAASLFEGSR